MKYFLMVLGVIVVVVGLSLLMAYPTMWAANGLLSPSFLLMIFGTSKLRFTQALLLNLLTGILFRSGSTGSSK